MADFELNVKVNGIEQTVSTIGALEQALAATNQQLSQVEQNSKEFSFLTNQASNLNTVLGALSTDANTFNQNLNNVNKSTTQLNESFTQTVNLSNEIGDNQSTKNLGKGINDAANKSENLRSELRRITIELQNLEAGSQRFQELSLRAGELRDQIGDTQAVVTALAGSVGERLGRSLASTVQIGIAGFQALEGVTALFGVEAEQLQPTLVRLNALLNLSQAIETFGGLGDKITEISAGFQSLTSSTEAATTAANANATATTAEATATTAAEVATTGSAIANSSNATANQADAAASLEDAAAKTIEAGATEAATVATTGLGLAMKALPIVAIAAAIGTLVYGIYQYVTANSKAKEEDEKRKKAIEDQQAAQKRLREERDNSIRGTVQETVVLERMLFQLKATTNGTKERSNLIKEINATYGTTLQNLQNETQFQQQLNDTIADYIAYQRVKVLQDINEAKFTEVVTNQQIALDKVKQLNISNYLKEQIELVALGQLKQDDIDYSQDAILVFRDFSNMTEKKRQSLKNLVFTYDDYIGKILDANYKLQDLGGTSAALSKQIEEFRKSLNLTTKTTVTNTKAVRELSAAQQFALDLNKERINQLLQLEIANSKTTSTLIDDIESERKTAINSLNDKLEATKKTAKEETTNKSKQLKELAKIQAEYDKFLLELNTDYNKRVQSQSQLELTERTKVLDDLKAQYDILNKEIQFGDQNTLDTFETLALRRRQLEIDNVNKQLENNNLTLKEFEALQIQKFDLQDKYNKEAAAIELDVADANRKKELLNYKAILEEKLRATFKFDYETLQNFEMVQDESLDALSKRLVEQGILEKSNIQQRDKETDEDFKARQKRELEDYTANLLLQAQAFQNLKKTQLNLDRQYAVDVEEINAGIIENTGKAAEETYKIQVQLLQDILSIANNALEQFSVESLSGFTNLISGSINAISQFASIQEQEFETSTEKIVAYAEVIGGLLNSVISGFVEQNQAALQQDLQNFEINTNAKKDALTNQLNNGLITRESYDNQIKALDKKLADDQLAAKKKAFEQDKKLRIAQATIAGLQGAVSAFAGAMQLGFPAGPIVGGILAAAVATLTGVQIAQIKKQQFDSGGTTVSVETPSTTSSASQAINQSSDGGFTTFNEGLMGTPGGFVPSTPFSGSSNQRVYVVESDITAAQNRVRVLEENSTFG